MKGDLMILIFLNTIVFRDMYFQCQVFQHAGYWFAHGELVGCDRLIDLAWGIRSSLCCEK